MSKPISLFFIVEDCELIWKSVTFLLEKCCEAGYDVFRVEFTFKDIEVNNLFLEKIIRDEKILKKRFNFMANYTLVCRCAQLHGLRFRGLVKNNFNIKLLFDDVTQFHKSSKVATQIVRFNPKTEALIENFNEWELVSIPKIDIPFRFKYVNGNYKNLLSNWLVSKDTVELKNFTELLKLILMKKRNDCEYNSCLGHILSMDSLGIVYWCKHNKFKTALGHISDFGTISDFFNSGQFEVYLDMHFQKREYCKSKCSRYDICQGGCPLNCTTSQKEKCTEQNFIEIIEHLSHELHREIGQGDFLLINKYARTIILNSIALTPFSDFWNAHFKSEKLIELV